MSEVWLRTAVSGAVLCAMLCAVCCVVVCAVLLCVVWCSGRVSEVGLRTAVCSSAVHCGAVAKRKNENPSIWVLTLQFGLQLQLGRQKLLTIWFETPKKEGG